MPTKAKPALGIEPAQPVAELAIAPILELHHGRAQPGVLDDIGDAAKPAIEFIEGVEELDVPRIVANVEGEIEPGAVEMQQMLGASQVVIDEAELVRSSVDNFRKLQNIFGVHTMTVPAATRP